MCGGEASANGDWRAWPLLPGEQKPGMKSEPGRAKAADREGGHVEVRARLQLCQAPAPGHPRPGQIRVLTEAPADHAMGLGPLLLASVTSQTYRVRAE